MLNLRDGFCSPKVLFLANGVNVAQAEVMNQESLAKQVLQETFGYQQFRPRPGNHH